MTEPTTASDLVADPYEEQREAARQSIDSASLPGGKVDAPGTVSRHGTLPTSLCLGWGLGALTIALMGNVFNLLVLRFATDYLGMAAAMAGMLLAMSKVFDAISDPVIGTISDNWKAGKDGRRRPLMRIAAFVCGLAIVGLFIVPPITGTALAIYYAVALLVFATAYGMWTVPYLAMSAEMTSDYHERSRLVSYRVNFGAIGLLISSICGPWLLVWFGGGRDAYQKMALVIAAAIVISGLACYRYTRGAPFTTQTNKQSISLTRQFRVIRGNRPLMMLLLIKVCWYFGFAANQATLAYFIKYVAGLSDFWLGNYYIILPVGMLAAQPAWLWLARRIDKRNALMLAMLGFGTLELSWLLTGPDEFKLWIVLRLIALGICAGGSILLMQSMFNDTIALDFKRSGERREGTFTGLFSLVEKSFSALGVAFVGTFLGVMGYVSSTKGAEASQPASAVTAVAICFAVVPFCTAVLSGIIVRFYRLDAADLRDDA